MLSIESSGTVTGNVAYRKLEVAKGGELLGTLKQL
jgi:cytoskeletal protein CcmA (bactofilin family)